MSSSNGSEPRENSAPITGQSPERTGLTYLRMSHSAAMRVMGKIPARVAYERAAQDYAAFLSELTTIQFAQALDDVIAEIMAGENNGFSYERLRLYRREMARRLFRPRTPPEEQSDG